MALKTHRTLFLALLTGSLLAPTTSALSTSRDSRAPLAPRSNPFKPTVRWSLESTAATPWIPRSVAFGVKGELVWAAPAVGDPHLLVASTAGDQNTAPLFEDHDLDGAIGPVLVRAGDQVGELFSLAQFPEGKARRTAVMAHDPRFSAISETPFAPRWTYDPGVSTDRPSLLECDPAGEQLVCATFDGDEVLLDWIDPLTGTREWRVSVAGTGLSALAISDASDRAAVVAGLDLWVVDRTGQVLHHGELSSSTKALALSADGTVLVHGDFGRVRVLTEAGDGFVEGASIPSQDSELPAAIALDDAGSSLAVGWWNFTNGTDVRLEVWDVPQRTLLVSREQLGSASGPQNLPEAVRLSADGTRAAFGLWGVSDSQPEVYLIDVPSDTDVLAMDLPGSVQAMELDSTGTRVVVGIKNAHANAFATTGAVMLLDSGERELQLLDAPERGGLVSVVAHRPGQIFTVLVIGYEADFLTPFRGWTGAASIDPTRPYIRRGVLPDRNAFSTRQFRVPDDPDLVGVEVAIQAVFLERGSIGFSNHIVRPTIF